MFSLPNLSDLLLSVPAVLWAITFHEFCHGYAAYYFGDPTAARMGRLTLNPLAHLDPIGALMLLLFRFGWAKPVPVDPRYFRNPARDMVFVSLAGPAGNILSAAVVGLLLHLFPRLFAANVPLFTFMLLMVYINLGLAVFNLIPIPPLDGSKILYVLLPPRFLRGFFWLERYGMFVLMALVLLNVIPLIMRPFVRLLARMVLPSWLPF